MSNVFCKACGAIIEEGSTFCNNCGKVVDVEPVPSYMGTPPPQPMTSATYSQQPNYSQNYVPPINQPYYQQQNAYQDSLNAPMTVSQYIGTFLLCVIPFVRLILLLVWAFSSDTNINKKNLARALLIIYAIIIGIYILVGIIIAVVAGSASLSAY